MGNAPDFLKEKADYVTDSIDHDGVVTALEHFGLSSRAPCRVCNRKTQSSSTAALDA